VIGTNLGTGQPRQFTTLNRGSLMRTFGIAPDALRRIDH
jgi:hypothetical protein